jgi:hypothetical protein
MGVSLALALGAGEASAQPSGPEAAGQRTEAPLARPAARPARRRPSLVVLVGIVGGGLALGGAAAATRSSRSWPAKQPTPASRALDR